MIFAVLLAHKKYDANLSTTHISHRSWAPSVMKYLFEAQVCRGQSRERMKNNSNSTKSGLLLNVFLRYWGDYSSLQTGGGGFCRNVSCQTNRTKQLIKYGRGAEFSFLPSPIPGFKEQKTILSDFEWGLLCILASITPKSWSETYGTWEQKNPCEPRLCDTCKINLFCFHQLLPHIPLRTRSRVAAPIAHCGGTFLNRSNV